MGNYKSIFFVASSEGLVRQDFGRNSRGGKNKNPTPPLKLKTNQGEVHIRDINMK